MDVLKKIELNKFLAAQPFMSIKPSKIDGLILEGDFSFSAQYEEYPLVNDRYKIRIEILNNFPFDIPTVIELEEKIPRNGNHHINPDRTLCLGSPLKLLALMRKKETLEGFIEYCLVPFLYAISLKRQYEIDFIFGELAHGNDGIVDEYSSIFNVSTKEEVENISIMLTLKKRVANKHPCPCGCGTRLGKCSLRFKINEYRKLAPRSWYSKNLEYLFKKSG